MIKFRLKNFSESKKKDAAFLGSATLAGAGIGASLNTLNPKNAQKETKLAEEQLNIEYSKIQNNPEIKKIKEEIAKNKGNKEKVKELIKKLNSELKKLEPDSKKIFKEVKKTVRKDAMKRGALIGATSGLALGSGRLIVKHQKDKVEKSREEKHKEDQE